jgi:hypothetical protein
MNKLLWRLFGNGQEYALYIVNKDIKRKQRWHHLQAKWHLHREAISWVTAFVVAIIITLIMILVVRAVVPV